MSAPASGSAPAAAEPSLDPKDWQSVRRTLHDAIDAALDHVQHIRDKPVWLPTPVAGPAR